MRKEQDQENNFIPEEEIMINFSRSGGKGGQNVNKVATKAEVRWKVDNSRKFSFEEKERIKRLLRNRLNQEGEIVLFSQDERSQYQNRVKAIKKLNQLIKKSLIIQRKRIATKPKRSAVERRLLEKKLQSEKKRQRNIVNY